MDEKFWDSVSRDYDGEIFDTIHSDRNGLIFRNIEKFGSKKGAACDFGCGVGKYLPALAKSFRTVHAIDISAGLLERARKAGAPFRNVTYAKGDLAGLKTPVGPVDFAVNANVLIMPSEKIRAGILKTVHKNLRSGGRLLLVVPSLESVLYVLSRHAEWRARPGSKAGSVKAEGLARIAVSRAGTPAVFIDGVETKHHLREELIVTLKNTGFEPESIEKVEYAWTTEFRSPPKWMGAPWPWDWMAIARRV